MFLSLFPPPLPPLSKPWGKNCCMAVIELLSHFPNLFIYKIIPMFLNAFILMKDKLQFSKHFSDIHCLIWLLTTIPIFNIVICYTNFFLLMYNSCDNFFPNKLWHEMSSNPFWYIFFHSLYSYPNSCLPGRPMKQEGPMPRGSLELRPETAFSDHLSHSHLTMGSCTQDLKSTHLSGASWLEVQTLWLWARISASSPGSLLSSQILICPDRVPLGRLSRSPRHEHFSSLLQICPFPNMVAWT